MKVPFQTGKGAAMTEEARKRYEEKTKRFYTTVDHKEPDRVPIQTGGEMFSIMQLGYTVKDCIYDKTMMKAKEAAEYFMLKYDPDTMVGLCGYAGEGETMELVSPKYMIWSGRPG